MVIKLEVERSINYREFRSVMAKLLSEKSNKSYHLGMIDLAIETFGTVDEKLTLRNAESIFSNLEKKSKGESCVWFE